MGREHIQRDPNTILDIGRFLKGLLGHSDGLPDSCGEVVLRVVQQRETSAPCLQNCRLT